MRHRTRSNRLEIRGRSEEAPTGSRRRAPRRARRARRTRAFPRGIASGSFLFPSVSPDAPKTSRRRLRFPFRSRFGSERASRASTASREETPGDARLGVPGRPRRRPKGSRPKKRRRRCSRLRRRTRPIRTHPRRSRSRSRSRPRSPPGPEPAATRTRSRDAKRRCSSGSTPSLVSRTRRGTEPRREREGISRRRASSRSRWTPSGARPRRRGTRSTRRTRVPGHPPGRLAEATRGSSTSGRTRGRTRGSGASWSPG